MNPHHRRWMWLLVILGVAFAARKAHGQSATPASSTLYQLGPSSTFQRGCFDPCACPIMGPLPLRGTFVLTSSNVDPLYQNYLVTNVSWNVPLNGNASGAPTASNTIHITGAGKYKVGGEFAITQQLVLDLKVDGDAIQHFDSGVVVGGGGFPHIDVTVSIHGQYCYDTVLHIDASPAAAPVPRHGMFIVDSTASHVDFSLFAGGTHSPLGGAMQLFVGDPSVPVIALVGAVGVSVDKADLVALDFEPNLTLPEPLHMINDPDHRSTGTWLSSTDTGVLNLDLYLKGVETGLPVPQPLHLTGHLALGELLLSGDNGNVPDGQMSLYLVAREVPLPPPPLDVWFSTTTGFTSGRLQSSSNQALHISDGDLLSRRGYIVRTNHQLTAKLGIMPIVPDLGLDTATVGPRNRIFFSFKKQNLQIWSETLGRYLKHGDLLSEDGYVVASNEDLLAKFVRMPPVTDAGLDAVALASNREILFSTDVSFFSEALGKTAGHGDVLSNRGRIVMTNAQLLAKFQISNPTAGPVPSDYGLDALIVRPAGEFWFSTTTGFVDQRWGAISDGDLLSTFGYVVARNSELLSAFAPTENVSNFGLDAACVPVATSLADFDLDGSVGDTDITLFRSSSRGPANLTTQPEYGDLDGDGDIDMDDFGLLQRCIGRSIEKPDCVP
jgi:hypothetical protein